MGRQAGADRCWRVVRQWEQLLRGEAALASGVAAEVAIRTSERILQDHPSSFARDGLGDRGNTVGIGMRLGAVPLHFMPLQLLRAIILSMKKKMQLPKSKYEVCQEPARWGQCTSARGVVHCNGRVGLEESSAGLQIQDIPPLRPSWTRGILVRWCVSLFSARNFSKFQGPS